VGDARCAIAVARHAPHIFKTHLGVWERQGARLHLQGAFHTLCKHIIMGGRGWGIILWHADCSPTSVSLLSLDSRW
jgi:hypothetical protein